MVETLLADGKGWKIKTPGPGYEIIKDAIETKLLNKETFTIVEKYIDDNWERILNEATEKALQHKANAIAFVGVKK